MNEKQRKVVGYGINISYHSTSFERIATFNDYNIAKEFYNALALSEEVKLGARIEIEKIYEVNDGFEYEVILKNYRGI